MHTVTLAEARSKALLAAHGVPVASEQVVSDADGAVRAASAMGPRVVVKLNGDRIAHKTERGLVRLGLDSEAAVRRAAEELLAAATPDDGDVSLIVAKYVKGNRELIAGVVVDPQLGPAVMLGIGGIFAEALGDVAFRLAPLDHIDAHELIDDLTSQAVLAAELPFFLILALMVALLAVFPDLALWLPRHMLEAG